MAKKTLDQIVKHFKPEESGVFEGFSEEEQATWHVAFNRELRHELKEQVLNFYPSDNKIKMMLSYGSLVISYAGKEVFAVYKGKQLVKKYIGYLVEEGK